MSVSNLQSEPFLLSVGTNSPNAQLLELIISIAVPDKPNPPSFPFYSRSYITASWKTNFSEITSFRLYFSSDSQTWSNFTFASDVTQYHQYYRVAFYLISYRYTFQNLQANTRYYFTLQVQNVFGWSNISDIVNFTTEAGMSLVCCYEALTFSTAMCGDSICDENEACSTCSFDCSCSM